jgi:hypothetical protein
VISATLSTNARERLVEAAVTARDRGAIALDSEERGDFAEANRQWGIVFRQKL